MASSQGIGFSPFASASAFSAASTSARSSRASNASRSSTGTTATNPLPCRVNTTRSFPNAARFTISENSSRAVVVLILATLVDLAITYKIYTPEEHLATPLIPLKVKRARPHASPLPLPQYQTELAAGLDLLADIDGEWMLAPLERRAVPTGLMIEIPAGFEGQVRPRSGLALKHGVTCLNSPGTVDADYRGEVMVILANVSNAPFTLRRGDRIAQLVLAEVRRAAVEEVPELSPTPRGQGGFGSTGR